MNSQNLNNPPTTVADKDGSSKPKPDLNPSKNLPNKNNNDQNDPKTQGEMLSNIPTSSSLAQNQLSNRRDYFINLELNNLKSYGYFYGIYCVPRHFKPQIWDGIIIIRAGLYKNAKFKFYMEFPRGFPKNKPELYFVSKVYHPLVDYQTGQLDMKLLSPEWKNNSTISHNLFAWLKSIFHDTNYLQITDSFNPGAGENFMENIDEFYEKVCETIFQSEKKLFEGEPTEGLKFQPYNSIHEKIQKNLVDVISNKEIPSSMKVNYFLDSILKENKSSM